MVLSPIDEVEATALEVKNETQEGGNNALKIGTLFYNIIQILKSGMVEIASLITGLDDMDKVVDTHTISINTLKSSTISKPDLTGAEEYAINNLSEPNNIYVLQSPTSAFPVYLPQCSFNIGKKITIISGTESLMLYPQQGDMINFQSDYSLVEIDNITIVAVNGDSICWVVLK